MMFPPITPPLILDASPLIYGNTALLPQKQIFFSGGSRQGSAPQLSPDPRELTAPAQS